MKAILKVVLAMASASSLSACVSMQSYVDPQYHHASYETVTKLPQPLAVKVTANFETNGKPKPAVDATLRNQVEQTLRASGVFTPTDAQDAPAAITVTGNNIADVSGAAAKGFGTGLTFGAAGSMVDDNYEFTFAYSGNNNSSYRAVYKHAIHTAIGHKSGPAGLTPTTPADAFNHVVQDVTLNFIQDLQDKGVIPKQ